MLFVKAMRCHGIGRCSASGGGAVERANICDVAVWAARAAGCAVNAVAREANAGTLAMFSA